MSCLGKRVYAIFLDGHTFSIFLSRHLSKLQSKYLINILSIRAQCVGMFYGISVTLAYLVGGQLHSNTIYNDATQIIHTSSLYHNTCSNRRICLLSKVKDQIYSTSEIYITKSKIIPYAVRKSPLQGH